MSFYKKLVLVGALSLAAAAAWAADVDNGIGLSARVADLERRVGILERTADAAGAPAAPPQPYPLGSAACPAGTCAVGGQCGQATCGAPTGVGRQEYIEVNGQRVLATLTAVSYGPPVRQVAYQPAYGGGCDSGTCGGVQAGFTGYSPQPVRLAAPARGGLRGFRSQAGGATCGSGGCGG